MFKYVKRYLHFALLAALFMVGEVLMDLLQPKLMSAIVDDGVLGLQHGGTADLGLIAVLGLKMAGLALFGGLCGSMNTMFSQLAGQNTGNDMRKDAFRQIMSFSFPQMDRFTTGSLVTRVTNDITQVQNFVSLLVRGLVRTSMLMFGSLFFLYKLNGKFGVIILCALPFVVGTMAVCLSRANPLFHRLQAQLDKINSIMQEDISGIRIIKACVRELYEKVRFGKANDDLIKTQLQVLTIFALMNPIVNALMYVAITAILLAGSYEVKAGAATPGSVMAAITYATQLLSGILRLTLLFQNISRGVASLNRVKEVLFSKPDLADGEFDGHTQLRGQVELKDVSFCYPGISQMVLKNISLTIYPGETVAIIGATGSGKSSLVNLIPRFYDATSGCVYVDGVDVRAYNQKALREKIAVALQKSELFSTSIRENIIWGQPGASEERVAQAAQIAQADQFIASSPNQYDTLVAERGMSLSGGQKQRLSIARAIVKDAEILIFDDSTSALDLKTEASLYAALKESSPSSTKIIIAQRIASIRQANRIVVLSGGKIEACGAHEELLKTCETYRDIYDSQLGEEEKHV